MSRNPSINFLTSDFFLKISKKNENCNCRELGSCFTSYFIGKWLWNFLNETIGHETKARYLNIL